MTSLTLAYGGSFTVQGLPLGRMSATPPNVRDFVRPLSARLMRQVSPRIRDLVAKDDVVIAVWDGESVARDGLPYRNNYVWVFRLRGDKAVEVEVFLDLEPYYDVLRRVPREAR